MASLYVHLSGRDTDDALLHFNGVKKPAEEKKESKLKPKNCPRCELLNPTVAKFCSRCAAPLDIKSAIALEESSSDLTQSFAEAVGSGKSALVEIVKNPEKISKEDIEKLAELLMPYLKACH